MKTFKINIIKDRKVIDTVFDSFKDDQSILNFVKSKYEGATLIQVTDPNDTDFFLEIPVID